MVGGQGGGTKSGQGQRVNWPSGPRPRWKWSRSLKSWLSPEFIVHGVGGNGSVRVQLLGCVPADVTKQEGVFPVGPPLKALFISKKELVNAAKHVTQSASLMAKNLLGGKPFMETFLEQCALLGGTTVVPDW